MALSVEQLSPMLASRTQIETPTLGMLAERERELIELHLLLAGGNRTHAARSLGLSREGLRKKMKRYGLE